MTYSVLDTDLSPNAGSATMRMPLVAVLPAHLTSSSSCPIQTTLPTMHDECGQRWRVSDVRSTQRQLLEPETSTPECLKAAGDLPYRVAARAVIATLFGHATDACIYSAIEPGATSVKSLPTTARENAYCMLAPYAASALFGYDSHGFLEDVEADGGDLSDFSINEHWDYHEESLLGFYADDVHPDDSRDLKAGWDTDYELHDQVVDLVRAVWFAVADVARRFGERPWLSHMDLVAICTRNGVPFGAAQLA